MKEYPIIFSVPMVRALLAGKKSQTRRTDLRWLKVRRGDVLYVREAWKVGTETETGGACVLVYRADGARRGPEEFTEEQGLWMADVWTADPAAAQRPYDDSMLRWRPSIHLPKWASRIRLIATEDARAERLLDITEADALAEGSCIRHDFDAGPHRPLGHTARSCFERGWGDLNGKRAGGAVAWLADPKIAVLTFRREGA